jgi:hypothetical protein
VIRRILATAGAAGCVAAGLIAPAAAHADPPQCGDGPIVMAGCTGPGDCTAVIDGQCVGVQPPLLPGSPPVRVGLQGDFGVGVG